MFGEGPSPKNESRGPPWAASATWHMRHVGARRKRNRRHYPTTEFTTLGLIAPISVRPVVNVGGPAFRVRQSPTETSLDSI
jgi:hypothetical protein